jgi:hypothetical protein
VEYGRGLGQVEWMPAARGQVASESMKLPEGGQSRTATAFCVVVVC